MVFSEISTETDDADASSALSKSSLTTAQASDNAEVEAIARAVESGRAAIGILDVIYSNII